jgi:hypothetical protein
VPFAFATVNLVYLNAPGQPLAKGAFLFFTTIAHTTKAGLKGRETDPA